MSPPPASLRQRTVGGAVDQAGSALATGGTRTFTDAVTDTGTMTLAASLVFDQLVGGTCSVDIGSGGVASLLAGSGSGLAADFLPSLGTLLLGNPLSFNGTITGFAAGDTIELANTPETKFSYADNVLTVTNGHTPKAQLHFAGSYTMSSFNVAQDTHGNTIITHT